MGLVPTDSTCSTQHPTLPLACSRQADHYFSHSGRDLSLTIHDWPGDRAYEPSPKPKSKAETKKELLRVLNTVRRSDPETAHEAARRYEPKRESAKGRVLAHLRVHQDQWVEAVLLTAPDIGGFAGTRRLRELRDDGWPIETRPKPGTTNVWQHRLVT